MTAPNAGSVSVEVLADASAFAKSLRKEVESAFKGLDFDKLIRDSIGNKPIKIPATPDFDTDSIGEKVRQAQAPKVKVDADTSEITQKIRATPVPKVKVEIDPLLAAFQAEVRSQVNALARTANAKIPIGADTNGLRAELGAELQAIDRSLKAEIPTEPGARGAYEAKLKAQLEEVSHRVKQSIRVEPEAGKFDVSGVAGLAGKITPNFLGGNAISGIATGFQALGDSVSKFAASAASGGSELASSVASAAGPVAGIVGGILAAQAAVVALGAAATVLVPAFAAAAGAAAAIPGALTGLGAAAGTLLLGFQGISEAFKPKAGGGGGASAGQSAAQQARQVASASRQVESARRGITSANRAYEASERSLAAAERGVATAQRNLVDAEQAVADAQKRAEQAQLAVNKARLEAVDDLVDLNLQLKGSKLSEQEATLAVTDALRELNAVKLTGNIPDIQKADLAYQRAQLTLQEATQSTKELSAQTADANAKGVEGSDKVQSALQNQHDALQGVQKAQEGVTDAQNGIIDAADSVKSAQDGVLAAADGIKSATDSLASAQDSLAQATTKQATAASAAAAKLIPLAPAAQKFVNALKALKPAFEDLRLDVQQRLFQGLDQTVSHLGAAWIRTLKTTLGSYADTFNGFFRNLGSAVSTPKFISDIAAGAEGFRQGLGKIFDAVTTKLVPAFGSLTKAAGPFLSTLGGEIASIVSSFGDWIAKADSTGKLQTFFEKAATAIHEIFTTGGLVVKIVGQIIGIIAGAQATGGKTALDSFNDTLTKVSNWLADPKHQKQIADFVNDLRNGFTNFATAAGKVDEFLNTIDGKKDSAHSVGSDIGAAIVAGIVAGVGEALKRSAETWLEYFSPFGPLVAPIKAALGIHSPSTVFADIGGDLIQGLINGIGAKLGDLGNMAGQLFGVVTRPLSGAATWLVNHGQNAVIGLQNGISRQLGNLQTRAGQLKTTVTNKLSDSGSWLQTHGGNSVIGFINGLGSRLGQLGSSARSIPSTLGNALSDAGNWLYTNGRAIVQGLINGISSALGTLGSFLGSVGTFIQQHKGPLPKDRLLLVPAGQAIMGGLISGIAGQKDQLASELADVTSIVANTQLPALGSGLDAALTSSLQASSQQQVLIGFKPGMTGDPILDALRQVIDIKHRGDPVAALSRS